MLNERGLFGLMLLFNLIFLLFDKFDQLHIYGKWPNDQVSWYVNGIIHELFLLNGSLQVFLFVFSLRSIQVHEALIILNLDEFFITDNETIPGHFEDVDLATYHTRYLASGILLIF